MNQDYAPAVLCECQPCTHTNRQPLTPAPHGYAAELVQAVEAHCADKLQSGACVRCAEPVQSQAEIDHQFHRQVDKDAALRHYAEQVQHAQDQKDAARFQWLLENPDSGLHLLGLLSQGKGDKTSFTSMVDRIMKSESDAKAARASAGKVRYP
jgi:succinate dehydrogenase flavin-adding protein (antitoxin of CptAB toxin-antitoxin module)